MITLPLSEYMQLLETVARLDKRVSDLMTTVESLQSELRLLRNGKASGTSHTPPSHQIGRSNAVSLREKTGRKPGGQPGHDGSTLLIKAMADKIIDYNADYCTGCGENLENLPSVLEHRRQEVVIPPPVAAQYVEHRSYTKTCTRCGQHCTGALPANLTAPIQYGSSVGAWISYLSVYQYISYGRIKTFLKDAFALPISEGSIDNLLADMACKAQPAYETIRQKVQQSQVVGGDETGASIGGKKGWFHTWQTPILTFIAASLNRGFETIEQYFAAGFPMSVYVSDCWAAQLKVTALLHQLCIAHLLRELNNFETALSCTWSKDMKKLLLDAITLKKQLTPKDYLQPPQAVTDIHKRLEKLLQYDTSASHQKVKAFAKRLIKNNNSVLTFLHHPKVPPDNNGSERAIRNVKVKTKVSGQFRTLMGATRFAIIRSIIDTTIKNSQNVFDALYRVANYNLE